MAKITNHPNGTVVRSKNKRLQIIKEESENLIIFTGLTKYIGNKSLGATISKNGKLKFTPILLSDEAIKDLYYGLHEYLNNKSTPS